VVFGSAGVDSAPKHVGENINYINTKPSISKHLLVILLRFTFTST
jgi:hypothetical protein